MGKKELKKKLEGTETVASRLSGLLNSMDVWDIDDKELRCIVSQYLAEYHVKSANLAIELKNMD